MKRRKTTKGPTSPPFSPPAKSSQTTRPHASPEATRAVPQPESSHRPPPQPEPQKTLHTSEASSSKRYNPFCDKEMQKEFSSVSFWPTEAKDLKIHGQLFEAFSCPADDDLFKDLSNGELLLKSMFHQGRFLSMYSRMLRREAFGQGGDKVVKSLEDKLRNSERQMQCLQGYNDDLRNRQKQAFDTFSKQCAEIKELKQQNESLEAEAKRNAELASQSANLQQSLTEALQKLTLTETQLKEVQTQNEVLEQAHRVEQAEHLRLETEQSTQIQQLQKKLTEANDEVQQAAFRFKKLEDADENLKTVLIKVQGDFASTKDSLQQFMEANRILQAEVHELTQQPPGQLQKELAELKRKLQSEEEKCAKLTEINRNGHAAHKDLQAYATELQTKYNSLKKRRGITDEQKQQIIQEYRASPELTEEIIDQFAQGYQAAKAKITEAGGDLKSLGFSEDEADMDDAQDPPTN